MLNEKVGFIRAEKNINNNKWRYCLCKLLQYTGFIHLVITTVFTAIQSEHKLFLDTLLIILFWLLELLNFLLVVEKNAQMLSMSTSESSPSPSPSSSPPSSLKIN